MKKGLGCGATPGARLGYTGAPPAPTLWQRPPSGPRPRGRNTFLGHYHPLSGGPAHPPGAPGRPDAVPVTSPSGGSARLVLGCRVGQQGSYTVATKLRKSVGPSCLCSLGQPKTQFTFLGISLPNCEHSQGGPLRLFLGGKGSVLGHFSLYLSICVLGAQNSRRRGDRWHLPKAQQASRAPRNLESQQGVVLGLDVTGSKQEPRHRCVCSVAPWAILLPRTCSP